MLDRRDTWRVIAYKAGRAMRMRGRPLSHNPWPDTADGREGRRHWEQGWMDQEMDTTDRRGCDD